MSKRNYPAHVIASGLCEAISPPNDIVSGLCGIPWPAGDCFVAEYAPRNDTWVVTSKLAFEETVQPEGFVRIPYELQARLRLQPGDRVRWQATGKGLLITWACYPMQRTATSEAPISETRRKLRTFAARMDHSKDMLATLREAREEAYQIVRDNQSWTDARATEERP